MKKIFYIIVVTVIALTPLNGIVKAEGLPDIPITNNLRFTKLLGEEDLDLSLNWSGVCNDEQSPVYYKKHYPYRSQYQDAKISLDNFCNEFNDNILGDYNKGYIVIANQSDKVNEASYSIILYPKSASVQLVHRLSNGKNVWNIKINGVDVDTYYLSNDIKVLTVSKSSQNGNTVGIGFSYMSYPIHELYNNKIYMIANSPNIIYPEGYTGKTPPSTITPIENIVPHFLVDLKKNGDLTVNYMQNLPLHPPEFYYKIGTGVDASNNMIDEIDSQRVQFRLPYKFNLETQGDYYLEISPNYHPPTVPPENPPPTVKFKITHDGTDKIWGNINNKLCTDDALLCSSPAENCNSYSFFLEKHSCILKQNTKLGVINTSILEMTIIYSKMRVDEKNYTCGFNLPTFKYQNQNVFNTTSIVTEGCQKSVVVHNTFPFIRLVVNFSFLMGVLWLFSRIINKILNRGDDNITEGLE